MSKIKRCIYEILLILPLLNLCLASTPIVMWHGMGDSCCSPNSLGYLKSLIEQTIPNVYVYSIQFGQSSFQDSLYSFWSDVNDKISFACDKIKSNPLLKDGYHSIGFSQGAQFLRALAQRCPEPRMKNLISLGGQHQGVYGLPNCFDGFICTSISRIVSFFAYMNLIQTNIVQAQYWHDPFNENEYKDYNLFLADINQEKEFKEEYKKNLLNLNRLVLVKFEDDEMVIPNESQVSLIILIIKQTLNLLDQKEIQGIF